MARRRIIAVVKIQIPAGQATPAPPVGTALGPHGVAIMEFCKQYNPATAVTSRSPEHKEGAIFMAQAKKKREALSSFDRDTQYPAAEALSLVKSLSNRKFDESVDVVARLGVDPRKADQMVRGTVGLPAGTGKEVRVAVFAQGDKATAAREAGADVVGAEDLVARIEGGFLDFDVAIASPDLLPMVGKL